MNGGISRTFVKREFYLPWIIIPTTNEYQNRQWKVKCKILLILAKFYELIHKMFLRYRNLLCIYCEYNINAKVKILFSFSRGDKLVLEYPVCF